MTNGAVRVPLRLFSDTMYPLQSVKPKEFGESTIGKRRYKHAPE
jgi:hypothetical protein